VGFLLILLRMFARAATRGQKLGSNLARSFKTQAGSSRGTQMRFASAAAVSAAAMSGMYAWQTSNSSPVACEPAPAPAPLATAVSSEPRVKNAAFIFIKPHAVTDDAKKLVTAGLQAKGINIVGEGTITSDEIDRDMLVDQHYYAIASKATLLKPSQLNVPAGAFANKFGIGWQEALDKGVVYNAKDACELLGVDSDGLNSAWAACKKGGKLIKFGGGFYCGLIDTIPGKEPIYVFNGFFMSMRNAYVKPGVAIHYYSVEWDASKLSWEDFRGKVLGPTDPEEAPKDSLRGLIMNDWKKLGLGFRPNVGDNGVHASASPFEGLAERMNWLGADCKTDYFGKNLIDAGISEKTIKEWSVDPQVVYGSKAMSIQASLFDTLEDTDSDQCIARAMMVNGNKSGGNGMITLGAAAAAGDTTTKKITSTTTSTTVTTTTPISTTTNE